MNQIDYENILSHKLSHNTDFNKFYENLEKKIRDSDNDLISKDEILNVLKILKNCEMGRFVIQNGGFNGYWTEYVCSFPEIKKMGYVQAQNADELFLLENVVSVLSTQERYQIFKNEIKKRLKDDIQIASLPCGLMNDILSQDYKEYKNFRLHGIDLDSSSLEQAKAIALSRGLIYHCNFTQEDAWNINYNNQFDLFTCNGLNIYVDNDDKLIEMYKKIFASIKKQGTLITSTLTPPPEISQNSTWKTDKISPENLKLHRIITTTLMQLKPSQLRSVEHMCKILEKSGFSNFEVINESYGIFITIIAHKT